jgi:hypothetical protein
VSLHNSRLSYHSSSVSLHSSRLSLINCRVGFSSWESLPSSGMSLYRMSPEVVFMAVGTGITYRAPKMSIHNSRIRLPDSMVNMCSF